ncbi:MAG TPA: nitric oxide synthase oxygenase [Rugosimonospora sp.]|nr:nitric oxide synthase oxygenase [Rugosimonospora sp.]
MPGVPGYRGTATAEWDADAPADLAEAEEFLRLFHAERPHAGPVARRLRQVRAEIGETGTYVHTRHELTFGAQVAWRNASRCIGRLYWRSLLVLDRRGRRTGDEIFDDLVTHLHVAGGGQPADADGPHQVSRRRPGQIRPVISVFDQARPGRRFARVWNDQLIRYAGYPTATGEVVGDPRATDFTTEARRLGWAGKGDPFDVLPIVLETPGEGVRLFELPAEAVLEVPLAHPEHRWFAELGLRWYGIPAIANMRMSIGGVHYPLAPFNGWYMGTEIGSRNLGDKDRYNLVPAVATRLGLDTSTEDTLWRDRSLVELNRAVLWSFARAGVRISDHHTESARFLAHVERERRAGRPTPADWTWIVPPMSASQTAVFHRYYHEADLRPSFYLDRDAAELARYGRVVTNRPRIPRQAQRVTLRPAVPVTQVEG